jgi:hypothetical protein
MPAPLDVVRKVRWPLLPLELPVLLPFATPAGPGLSSCTGDRWTPPVPPEPASAVVKGCARRSAIVVAGAVLLSLLLAAVAG